MFYIKKLTNTLAILSTKVEHAHKINVTVSSANVAWHIEHCLLVIIRVIETIKLSDPTAYKSKFTFPKFIVLTTGKIPRGKARAPKLVLPANDITIENLQQNISLAKQN